MKYPETEVTAWLELPITQDYLQCIHNISAELGREVGKGACLDPRSADHTFASYNQVIGKLAALNMATAPYDILDDAGLILEDEQ